MLGKLFTVAQRCNWNTFTFTEYNIVCITIYTTVNIFRKLMMSFKLVATFNRTYFAFLVGLYYLVWELFCFVLNSCTMRQFVMCYFMQFHLCEVKMQLLFYIPCFALQSYAAIQ